MIRNPEPTSNTVSDEAIVEHTRRWISSFVIGLGLCPFARAVFDAGRIRYAVSHARDETGLACDLAKELNLLVATPSTQIETTILIHPHVLGDFLQYNEFLDVVDDLLDEFRLRGVVQVASFHPHYQFAATAPDAAENYTNRSPYPMLHLLREASVSQAVDSSDEARKVPERNIETLRNLGRERILKRLQSLDADRGPSIQ